MFAKMSLFTVLNNLTNISLSPSCATICGFTDSDLDRVFASELSGLDRHEIRRWCNGYHWLGDEKPYNPFDMLLFFRESKYKPYWFETGETGFVCRLMMERNVNPMDMENRIADEDLVSKFDVEILILLRFYFKAGTSQLSKKSNRMVKRFTT